MVTNKGRLYQRKNAVKTYSEYLEEGKVPYKRAVNTGTFVKGETTKGISQLPAMENHLKSSRTLYFIRNTLDIYGSLSSLVDFAAGGKDVNAVAASALSFLDKSLEVRTLLFAFGKITLDVMQTPVKEFFEDMRNASVKEMNAMKFKGITDLRDFVESDVFLMEKYHVIPISYQTMQDLLNGKIKKQKDLKSAYNEVIILYKEIEDGILIDSFFVK
ncbi:hypothetical protein CGC58_11585 [Capnocytophaga stomatis]|uniref:Uncharacterized protein n=1 Tax=Capnocytophaga stomatis TaxID=1848904 RepID=A0A250G0P5_9FLAO|nr:hypothetical protein [Capnocytophaga stomatis]ATA90315.1 hypothetical protein CGC58_11585 [Capnocytophaga stomatis]